MSDDIPADAIVLETVTIVKYIDAEGHQEIESFFGDPHDGRDVDYDVVLELLEAGKYTAYRDMIYDDLYPRLLDDLRYELSSEDHHDGED